MEEEILIEKDFESEVLVISFAGLGDNFQFKKMFGAYNFKRIYVRDLKHHWYLNGLKQVGENVEAIKSYFETFIRVNNIKKVLTIGSSAGGFAAILYGTLLGVDQIIAFSPQTFMDKFHRLIYHDRRWKDRNKEIYALENLDRTYLDIKSITRNYKGELFLFHDKKHRLDNIHCRRINCEHKKVFNNMGGGHSLVSKLKKDEQLEYYLNKVSPGVFEKRENLC